MVTLAVNTVAEVTDEALIVYGTPELLLRLRLMPLAKFVPSIDKVCWTEDATIPAGVIEVMVGAVLAGVALSPQDTSPNAKEARPASRQK